jgi:hypothetical protein
MSTDSNPVSKADLAALKSELIEHVEETKTDLLERIEKTETTLLRELWFAWPSAISTARTSVL